MDNKFLGAVVGDFSESLVAVSQHLFHIRHQQMAITFQIKIGNKEKNK